MVTFSVFLICNTNCTGPDIKLPNPVWLSKLQTWLKSKNFSPELKLVMSLLRVVGKAVYWQLPLSVQASCVCFPLLSCYPWFLTALGLQWIRRVERRCKIRQGSFPSSGATQTALIFSELDGCLSMHALCCGTYCILLCIMHTMFLAPTSRKKNLSF